MKQKKSNVLFLTAILFCGINSSLLAQSKTHGFYGEFGIGAGQGFNANLLLNYIINPKIEFFGGGLLNKKKARQAPSDYESAKTRNLIKATPLIGNGRNYPVDDFVGGY